MSELNEIECGQLCQTTIESLYKASGGLREFPGLLKKIIKTKAWEKRFNKGRVIELASLRELITEKPIRGWGEDPKKIEAIIKDDAEALLLYREAMKLAEGTRTDLADNVSEVVGFGRNTEHGNSRAYSLDRVVRECEPEVVGKVMSGEMSPNAALVKAGLRENRQIYIPKDPAKALEKLREAFGEEFVQKMLKVN